MAIEMPVRTNAHGGMGLAGVAEFPDHPAVTMASALSSAHVNRNQELENCLLEMLPADGSPVGNGRAQQELGCSGEEYAAAKAALLDKGVIQPGPGRGGSIRLTAGMGKST